VFGGIAPNHSQLGTRRWVVSNTLQPLYLLVKTPYPLYWAELDGTENFASTGMRSPTSPNKSLCQLNYLGRRWLYVVRLCVSCAAFKTNVTEVISDKVVEIRLKKSIKPKIEVTVATWRLCSIHLYINTASIWYLTWEWLH